LFQIALPDIFKLSILTHIDFCILCEVVDRNFRATKFTGYKMSTVIGCLPIRLAGISLRFA
jgi:hypothetical protein